MASPLNKIFFDFIILNNSLEKNFTKLGDLKRVERNIISNLNYKNEKFLTLSLVTKVLPIIFGRTE
ncbi:hypothetical protein PROVRETT_07586 [Providencia rettgeri DSM 1131]|uniref:Uncharacterized protein n=1 Tax=Providencia rettgeri TaxID=587 RepID=A0A2A5QB49_PRORE|nr:hypothetical protein PROVRETT_07586 [Providencia rettgeri DSM 1131]OZS75638.1 hypothetical protein CHI95_04960 [Providencia rettgeri]PCQ39921.1 hypothetical protein CQA26_01525 [Providencia rettgeri]PYZ60448.1 hypothetical protein DNK63_15590 [Providencia rettgeri]BBU97144.1 hypothetical protein BML2496_30270 [Providencia rettgeri]